MEHAIDELRRLRFRLAHERMAGQDRRQVGIRVCRLPCRPRLRAEFQREQGLATDIAIDRAPAVRTARQARRIPVLLVQVDAGKPAPDDFDAPLVFLLVRRIDPDPRVQALVARVDQGRDRHAAGDDRMVLFFLGDRLAGLVAVELDQHMAERGDILVLRPALGHRVDAQEQPELGAEHAVDAALGRHLGFPLGWP